MQELLFIGGCLGLWFMINMVSDVLNGGYGLLYFAIAIGGLIGSTKMFGTDNVGTQFFILNFIMCLLCIVAMIFDNAERAKYAKQESQRREQEDIERELDVVECFWSFKEDGKRYCCKEDELIQTSVAICIANCKGYRPKN